MIQSIDVNCDVGEGFDNESQLMPYIKYCSIACGGHSGDQYIMKRVVQLANKHQVLIGTHPSYPDKTNFGRVSMSIEPEKLILSIRKQLNDLMMVLKKSETKLHHIKPHGALYNDIAIDESIALVFLEAIAPFKNKAILFVPFNSVIAKRAKELQFSTIYEAFADRRYNRDLSLVSRNMKEAVINDCLRVGEQVKSIALRDKVIAIDGEERIIKGDTFCVHSDTKNARELVKYLSDLTLEIE